MVDISTSNLERIELLRFIRANIRAIIATRTQYILWIRI